MKSKAGRALDWSAASRGTIIVVWVRDVEVHTHRGGTRVCRSTCVRIRSTARYKQGNADRRRLAGCWRAPRRRLLGGLSYHPGAPRGIEARPARAGKLPVAHNDSKTRSIREYGVLVRTPGSQAGTQPATEVAQACAELSRDLVLPRAPGAQDLWPNFGSLFQTVHFVDRRPRASAGMDSGTVQIDRGSEPIPRQQVQLPSRAAGPEPVSGSVRSSIPSTELSVQSTASARRMYGQVCVRSIIGDTHPYTEYLGRYVRSTEYMMYS